MVSNALQVFDDEEFIGVVSEDSHGQLLFEQGGRKVRRYLDVQFDKLFGDLMPDEWASNMLKRTMYSDESLQERVEGKKCGLSKLDKVRVTKDLTRQGSLRFKELGEGEADPFVYGKPGEDGLPVLDNVETFEELNATITEYKKRDIEAHKLRKLNEYVGSIGGARPKMSALNAKRELAIVKFTSSGEDSVGSPAGEALSIELAALCGIEVPEFQFFRGVEADAICIKRFDRVVDLDPGLPAAPGEEKGAPIKRLPYASIHSILHSSAGFKGKSVAMNSIARTLLLNKSVALDAVELFKRYAFTILVHNSDDHLGNIGFLYDAELERWKLAPQFDCVPDTDILVPGRIPVTFQGGVISSVRNRTLQQLLDAAKDFQLEADEAKDLLEAMMETVRVNYEGLIDKYIAAIDQDTYRYLFKEELLFNSF